MRTSEVSLNPSDINNRSTKSLKFDVTTNNGSVLNETLPKRRPLKPHYKTKKQVFFKNY